jgi:endonuclease/exonuclease/phosphatase family metal-dependent hydrolase
VARLDRIALCDSLQATRVGRHLVKPAHIASDHLPVWADLAART